MSSTSSQLVFSTVHKEIGKWNRCRCITHDWQAFSALCKDGPRKRSLPKRLHAFAKAHPSLDSHVIWVLQKASHRTFKPPCMFIIDFVSTVRCHTEHGSCSISYHRNPSNRPVFSRVRAEETRTFFPKAFAIKRWVISIISSMFRRNGHDISFSRRLTARIKIEM